MTRATHLRRRHLRLIHGAPRTAQQRQTAALAALALDWRARLEAVGVAVDSLPFRHRASNRVLWLPEPRQALLLASDTTERTLRLAEDLSRQVGGRGPRPFVHESDDEDVRVVLGFTGGRFAAYRGGSIAVYRAAAFYLCAECRRWWSLLEWNGWQCRCCGAHSGNAGVAAQFTDAIPSPRPRRWSA